jgi:hypothetical protein
MEWLEKLGRIIKPGPEVPPPTWNESGIFASTGTETVLIGWQEITAIYAYKKDCLTVDQIRIIFASEQWNIEFTEDDKDFDALRMYIDRHLRVLPDWHQLLVLSPAFATTWTVVYRDESVGGSEISE